MNKKLSIAAVALSLALVGCSGTEATVSEPQDAAEVTEQQPEAPEATFSPEPAPEPEPTQEAPELAAYGDTYTYEDGLEVTIEYAGPATATEYAAGAEETNGQVVLFKITVTNGTGQMIDPTMYMSNVSFGEKQKVAEEVFDSGGVAEGLMSSFPTNLLPGKSTTATGAWAMPHGKKHEVLFSFAPTFDHEPALFYGTINAK